MALLSIKEVMTAAENSERSMNKTASIILNEAAKRQPVSNRYDIFLSHSFRDAKLILGVKEVLTRYGYTIYIDWIDDPQLDRSCVTPKTAETLRKKMSLCKCLFYATTESSSMSKWMPWECGYMDGKFNRSAILPIADPQIQIFSGQEYLGIYPHIDFACPQGKNNKIMWVCSDSNTYCSLEDWLNGKQPCEH